MRITRRRFVKGSLAAAASKAGTKRASGEMTSFRLLSEVRPIQASGSVANAT